MSKKLIYKSEPLSLKITDYKPVSFLYEGWEVSDEYEYCAKHESFSKYCIILTSMEVKCEEELSEAIQLGYEIVNRITELIPYCALLSLREPKICDGTRTRRMISYRKAPQSWNFNYHDVKEYLDSLRNLDRIKISVDVLGFNPFAVIEKSPLIELKIMLNNYECLSEKIRYLIFLHNAIIESEDKNRYMLIGKALEIINALYPYNRGWGKEDLRIETYFPDLRNNFKGITIRELISLSNNRREARHFIAGKDASSHPEMSEEEREKYYTCATLLLTNVVRRELGLDIITINRV